MSALNAAMETLLISKGYTSNATGTGMLDLIKASKDLTAALCS
jgi:hypothetical protein